MKQTRPIIVRLFLTLLAVILAAAPLAAESGEVLRIKDRAVVPWSQMFNDLKESRLVYIGENHDNGDHHQAQLRIIRGLQERGGNLAIAVEMFQVADQPLLDQWVAGEINEDKFKTIFLDRWRLSWELYQGIFRYARQQKIPLVAINIPRELVKKVAQSGFAALSEAERREIPPDVSCIIDPTYKEFIRRTFANHQSGQSFEYFCEAQMLWTKSMARHLVTYLNRNPGRSVLVLTGVGHALRPGIPAYVEELKAVPYRIAIPEIRELTRTSATGTDLDYLLLSL